MLGTCFATTVTKDFSSAYSAHSGFEKCPIITAFENSSTNSTERVYLQGGAVKYFNRKFSFIPA